MASVAESAAALVEAEAERVAWRASAEAKRGGKKNFYSSLAWRSLRYKFIAQSDGKCCVCGRSARVHGVVMHVDHIVPVSKDWNRRLDITNLELMCEDDNMGKGNKDSKDWRPNPLIAKN